MDHGSAFVTLRGTSAHVRSESRFANQAGYYAESSHARTLTTRDLRTPTAHIYFLQIVNQRSLDTSVPHQLHERGQAHAGADHVGGKAMPEAMWVGELDLSGLTMVAK